MRMGLVSVSRMIKTSLYKFILYLRLYCLLLSIEMMIVLAEVCVHVCVWVWVWVWVCLGGLLRCEEHCL